MLFGTTYYILEGMWPNCCRLHVISLTSLTDWISGDCYLTEAKEEWVPLPFLNEKLTFKTTKAINPLSSLGSWDEE